MKQNKKQIVYSFLFFLVPVFVGLIFSRQLPNQVAIHFDFSGTADQFANKWAVMIGLPALMALIHGIVVFSVCNDPKKNNIGAKMTNIILWMLPVFTLALMLVLYGIALGWNIDILNASGILVGVLFMVLGNYLSKNRQNYTVGIRTPWTLNSRENWNRTHRLAGKIWMISGLAAIGFSFVKGAVPYVLLAIVVCSLIPVGYSFFLYKRGI